MQQLALLVVGAPHDIADVVAGKRPRVQRRRVHVQLLGDVGHHARCGRGGEREHGHAGQCVAQIGQPQVRRAEVVAPLRDAVGLVDHDEAHVPCLYLGGEVAAGELLGREVCQAHPPQAYALERHGALRAAQPRVDGRRRDAGRGEIVYLVFHERDERCHHYGDSAQHHGRHLKGDGFAAARGQQADGIVPVEHRADNLGLALAEGVVAPVAAEYVDWLHGRSEGGQSVSAAVRIWRTSSCTGEVALRCLFSSMV